MSSNSVNHINSVNSVNSVNNVNSVNRVNSVNSFNSYSAVLPPSPMVFFIYVHLINVQRINHQSLWSWSPDYRAENDGGEDELPVKLVIVSKDAHSQEEEDDAVAAKKRRNVTTL